MVGEEENEMSQQQRQEWFQKVEQKSKSGDWDDGKHKQTHTLTNKQTLTHANKQTNTHTR